MILCIFIWSQLSMSNLTYVFIVFSSFNGPRIEEGNGLSKCRHCFAHELYICSSPACKNMKHGTYHLLLNHFLKMQTPVYGQQVTAINQQPTAIAQAHIQHPAAYQQQRNRPLNRWGDSIFDWLTNLYPSCYCACCVCYGMYIVSQSKYHINISCSILKMNYIKHVIIISMYIRYVTD